MIMFPLSTRRGRASSLRAAAEARRFDAVAPDGRGGARATRDDLAAPSGLRAWADENVGSAPSFTPARDGHGCCNPHDEDRQGEEDGVE